MTDASPARVVILGVRGLLEVGVLLAVAYWAYATVTGLAGFVLAVAVPLTIAIVWATLGSPKAPRRLPEPYRGSLALVLFGVGAGALWAVGHPLAATAFAVVAAVDTVTYYAVGGD